MLGVTNVPNLAGQFVRGADGNNPLNSRKDWTTGLAKNRLTGTAAADAGSRHAHRSPVHRFKTPWKGGGTPDYVLARTGYGQDNNINQELWTKTDGAHAHAVTISGGGNSATAPDHVGLHFVIKAMDIAVRVRI